jgi:hypothetical protein
VLGFCTVSLLELAQRAIAYQKQRERRLYDKLSGTRSKGAPPLTAEQKGGGDSKQSNQEEDVEFLRVTLPLEHPTNPARQKVLAQAKATITLELRSMG